MQYNTIDFSSYVVCGFKYNTKRRFTIKTSSWFYAMGINLWRGNVYGISKETGKRIKLKSVYN